ncbi:MAG: hypothetical protein EBR40_10345 [Proteobacteria bacterium]|nr:hypothetical protein [Pseudomonadota bacterium]
MARPLRKIADPWTVISTDSESERAIWEHAQTGERRIIPVGFHPNDAGLQQPAVALPVDEDFEETATDRIAVLLQAAQSDARAEVKVYRISQGKLQYCRGYDPAEFEEGNLDMLRERYGPGEYEIRLYATDPATNKFVIRNKARVDIAAEQPRLGAVEPQSGLGQVLTTIAEGQRAMLEALTRQAPQRDAAEEMTKMLGMMKLMREAMGMDAAPAQRSTIGEIVTAIKELKGAAREIIPDERDEDADPLAMAGKIISMVQATQAQPQPQAMPVVSLPETLQAEPQPQPNPTPEMPAFENPEDELNFLTMLTLKAHLKSLVAYAVKNAPIEKAAQYVFDRLPDDLLEIMESDEWFTLLAQVAPETKDHKEYLEKVRAAALKLFEAESQQDD